MAMIMPGVDWTQGLGLLVPNDAKDEIEVEADDGRRARLCVDREVNQLVPIRLQSAQQWRNDSAQHEAALPLALQTRALLQLF